MADPNPIEEYVDIRFRLPRAAAEKLDELLASGLYGAERSTVARRLTEQGLERRFGLIVRMRTNDTPS
jgi:hypothetical protein